MKHFNFEQTPSSFPPQTITEWFLKELSTEQNMSEHQ